jgi:hypothetical protein
MVSRMRRLARARLVIVALLAQACAAPTSGETNAPSAGLPEASSSPFPTAAATSESTPVSTGEATAAPSAAPPLPASGVSVEHVGLPEGADSLLAGMWDERGWIVVGVACSVGSGPVGGDPHDCYPDEAAVWTSVDARTWQRAELANGDTGWMSAVTHWRDAYYAASSSKCGTFHFWHSTDVRAWEEVGSIDGGTPSGDDGCPFVEHLAGGPGGLVATLSFSPKIPSRMIRSTDGATWNAIDLNTFGERRDYYANATNLVATGNGVAIARGCGSGYCVWTTRDGISWTKLAEIDNARGAHAAAIGGRDRLVVGGYECRDEIGAEEICETFLHATSQDGTFRKVAAIPDLSHPQLAWTGNDYMLVGQRSGVPQRVIDLWVSRDGLEWEEAPINLGTCTVSDLIGGPSVAMVVGYYHRCRGLHLLIPS